MSTSYNIDPENIRLIQSLYDDLRICPECKKKLMRVTPKKKIMYCFNCGKDIGYAKI